jgi:hypothetical protein
VAGLDLGGSSDPLLIVAPRRGAAPRVRIYDAVTGKVVRSFLAYPNRFRGGISLAATSFDGGTRIVTAAGRGGRPVVKVFDALTGRPLLRIRAFDHRHRGGTTVSISDSPDGSAFSITARTRWHGRTLTRVFDGTTGAPLGEVPVTRRKGT